jgi:hypothetical protein
VKLSGDQFGDMEVLATPQEAGNSWRRWWRQTGRAVDSLDKGEYKMKTADRACRKADLSLLWYSQSTIRNLSSLTSSGKQHN